MISALPSERGSPSRAWGVPPAGPTAARTAPHGDAGSAPVRLGSRRSKMRCGLSADVRVGVLGEMWSHLAVLAFGHQPGRRRAAAPNQSTTSC